MNKIEFMQHHNFDLLDMSRIIKCKEPNGEITNIFDCAWMELNAEYIARLEYLTNTQTGGQNDRTNDDVGCT